ALREGAVVNVNREGFLGVRPSRRDIFGIDHRNPTRFHTVDHRVGGDLWNVLIKFSGLRTPPALFEAAARGVGGAVRAIKREPSYNFMGRGRDEGDEGRVLTRTRDHDQMIYRIETEFVSSALSADINELAGAQNIRSRGGIEYPH